MEGEKKSKTIEDTGLIDSLSFLKEKKLLPENKSKVIFETVKEAEDSAKEDVLAVINEKRNNLRQEISELQKKGYDLRLTALSLLQIPLKAKLWLASPSRDGLEKIFEIVFSAERKITPLKKELEEKERQKEEELKKREKEELERSKKPSILEEIEKEVQAASHSDKS